MKRAVSFVCALLIVSTIIFVRSNDKCSAVVSVLKTGNSDCIIIKTNNYNIMLDTALESSYTVIKKHLNNMNIKRLDYLILTHFDKDHIGSASKIIKEYKPSIIFTTYPRTKIYSPAHKKLLNTFSKYSISPTVVENTTKLTLGDVVINIYPPHSDYYVFDSSNNSSLVVTMECGTNSFFFGADIEESRINEILNNGVKKYDVLKVPHHGIMEPNSTQLFKAVSAKYAIITAGHKREEAVSALKRSGSYVYSTHKGVITFRCYPDYMSVSQNLF